MSKGGGAYSGATSQGVSKIFSRLEKTILGNARLIEQSLEYSENSPSQMIFILLPLSTDAITLKVVKSSNTLFVFNVPLLAVAIAVTGIFFNCKWKKLFLYFMTAKSSSSIFNKNNWAILCASKYFVLTTNTSIHSQYILLQTTTKEGHSSAKPSSSCRWTTWVSLAGYREVLRHCRMKGNYQIWETCRGIITCRGVLGRQD